jgi:outer membrane immunogenic protein
MAADMRIKAPPPQPAAAYPVWSGFYIGAHVGYAWGDFDFRDPFIKINQPVLGLPGLILGVPLERSFDGDSFLGGVQGGVNAQFGPLVVGVEADVSRTNVHGSFRSTSSALGGFITTSEGVAADLEWLATVRGRVGWAFNRFMVYGTGGVAFGSIDAEGDITISVNPGIGTLSLAASDRRTHVGWTAGAGIEGMIIPALSAKLEYLYADLGWLKHEGPVAIGGTLAALVPPGLSITGGGDFRLAVHTVRFGINYHFGGPLLARY